MNAEHRFPTLEIVTPSGQIFNLEARPNSYQLLCIDNYPEKTVTHLAFRKDQMDTIARFIIRMNAPHVYEQRKTCIQCEYCDIWDMTCANIDNADDNGERMAILPEYKACKHFTPERINTESKK